MLFRRGGQVREALRRKRLKSSSLLDFGSRLEQPFALGLWWLKTGIEWGYSEVYPMGPKVGGR